MDLNEAFFWIFVGLFWDESHEKSVKKPQKWSIPSTNMVNQHGSGNHLFWLVLWNMNFVFPFSWEFHHPNWLYYIFQRGRSTTNQKQPRIQGSSGNPQPLASLRRRKTSVERCSRPLPVGAGVNPATTGVTGHGAPTRQFLVQGEKRGRFEGPTRQQKMVTTRLIWNHYNSS